MGFATFLVKPLIAEGAHEAAAAAARDAGKVAVEAEARGTRAAASGAARSTGKAAAESAIKSAERESVVKSFGRGAAKTGGKVAVGGAVLGGGAYELTRIFHNFELPALPDFPDFTQLPHVLAQFLDKVNPLNIMHNVESGLRTGFLVVLFAGGAYVVYLIFK